MDKTEELGFYKLIGIYKGKDLLPFSKNVDYGMKPRYLKNITPAICKKTNCRKKLYSGIFTPDIEDLFIPISIETDNSNLFLVNEYKSYLGIVVTGEVKINDVLTDGYYKLDYDRFEKTSDKREIFLSKGSVSLLARDSTEDLLNDFDEIVKNSCI